jgi:N-acetylmuramoyl-L-alanine amidase
MALRNLRTIGPTVLVLAFVAACNTGTAATSVLLTSSPSPTTVADSPAAITPTANSSSTPLASAAAQAKGRVIVLDPGHNGGNSSHVSQISRLVPAGRGQEKACNTTGTSTNDGYPEHEFNWLVANDVRTILQAKGFKVVMTRTDDTSVGPCVNERAAIGNNAAAAAVVSIHADGNDKAGARGFHVAYSSPALNGAQGSPSTTLATDLRNAMVGAGFPTSNYLGSNGLDGRNDLAGLNLSTRPIALVECGNMRDSTDATSLISSIGQQKYAQAIAVAIEKYVS